MDARPRDAARTRQRITSTAETHFAQLGFDRTTVRAIAADAGVSPNLITRYFGGKQGLFAAVTEVDLRIVEVLPGPRAGLGARIAAHVVRRWEGRPGQDPLLTMLRSAMTDPAAAERMSDYFRRQAAAPLAEHLGTPDAHERAAAVSSMIMGTVVQRYALASGPLADADADAVTAWLGHTLTRLLSGPVVPALR